MKLFFTVHYQYNEWIVNIFQTFPTLFAKNIYEVKENKMNWKFNTAILNNICGIKTNKIETGCRSLKVLLQQFVIYATSCLIMKYFVKRHVNINNIFQECPCKFYYIVTFQIEWIHISIQQFYGKANKHVANWGDVLRVYNTGYYKTATTLSAMILFLQYICRGWAFCEGDFQKI